jgi:hypothetical protein
MPETHVIEYEITEEQAAAAADAVLGSLAIRLGQARLRGLVVQSVLYAIISAVLVAFGVHAGQPWWFFVAPILMVGVVALLLGLAAVLSAVGPWQRRRLDAALRGAFARLESPRIRWTVTEDQLAVQSGRDVREFGWEDVKDVYLTGTFWIMTLADGPNMLLLADRIPDATARFLLTRARDAGATIRVAGRPSPTPEDNGVTD